MIVIIWHDYAQLVVLWFDKNNVYGYLVFLFCCSVESYTLLWLVQQVATLPVVIYEFFIGEETSPSEVMYASVLNGCHFSFYMEFPESKPIRSSSRRIKHLMSLV